MAPSTPDQHTSANTYLSNLSELAGHSFVSTQEAVEAILRLVVEQLGLRSGFLTHISPEARQNEILVAYNSTGDSDVQEGALLKLPQTF